MNFTTKLQLVWMRLCMPGGARAILTAFFHRLFG